MRTRRVWPPSTIRTLPSSPLLLDDRALVALFVGERLPITRRAERFTTTYFWFRACRAVVVGAGGQERAHRSGIGGQERPALLYGGQQLDQGLGQGALQGEADDGGAV